MSNFFKIKNFEKFQHYKERNPPWIKIHKTLLADFEFAKLPDSTKFHLIGLWLLAAAHDNRLPCDSAALKRRLNATSNVNLNTLFSSGFIIPIVTADSASKELATCKQSACLETETETETETEEKHMSNSPKNGNSGACEKVEIPRGKKPKPEPAENEKWFLEDWDSYPRKAGNRKKALACYLKTVKTETDRQAFQRKMESYVASVRDEQFLKHGETFFRNWMELEVGDEINADERVRKRDKHEADKKAELDRLEKYKQLLLETLEKEPDEFLSHKLSETEAAIESVKNWTIDIR